MTSQTPTELPLLTFNSLYNLLREEKKSKSLTFLPEFFYESLNNFLDEKKKRLKNSKNPKKLKNSKKKN